ncbi:hypothetical protein ACFWP5_08745 [Streptomyces sp. NPDC058469]|uniref:hypothetical protein n=1 Tax=Streptomyces sp. NPDC058469 TaxID=3346514 RepID=UPI00365F63BE
MNVTQRAAGANMSVDVNVSSGMAGILMATSTKIPYFGYMDAAKNISVTASDPSNPRIDTVVAYVDLTVISSATTNNLAAFKFKTVPGTAAGSPTAPNAAAIQASIGAGYPYEILADVAVAAAASSISNANITDRRTAMTFVPTTYDTKANSERRWDEGTPNYVASGCVWSGDAYASTRAASMIAGVVYINGVRLTVAAVTARTFTASKDTYIELHDNGDGTAVVTYDEVANNAASPALTANYVRIGIIITGVSTIAAASSINQGTTSTPVVSSVPLLGADSLGNQIYPHVTAKTHVGLINPYTFSVYRAAALTPAAGGVLTCDTKEYDTGNNVDVVTNKGRFTAPIAGLYSFKAEARFLSTTNTQNFGMTLNKNGVVVKNGSAFVQMFNGATSTVRTYVNADIRLAANEYVEAAVLSDGTEALNVSGVATDNYFQGFLVSTT